MNSFSQIDFEFKFFSRIVCSQFISNLTDRAAFIIFMWWITTDLNSKLLTPFLFVSLLPHVAGLFFSENLIRKFGPVKIVIVSDSVKFFVLLIMAIIIYPSDSPPQFIELCFFSFILNLGSCLFNPAIMSMPVYLSDCSKRKQKMSCSLSLSFSLAILAGPLLATILLKSCYYSLSIFILCLAYFIAVINNYMYRHYYFAFNSGLINKSRIIWLNHKHILYLLICFCLLNIVFVPIQSFIPLYAKYVLKGGSDIFATLEAALGLGSIFGCLLLIKKSIHLTTGSWLLYPFLFAGLAYMVFAFSTHFSVSVGALIFLGASLSIGNILAINYYQTRVSANYVPGVMVWVNMISVAVGPLAMVLCGLFENHFGLINTMIFYSLTMLLVSLAIIFVKYFEKGTYTYEQV